MNETPKQEKIEHRARLAADVEAFLAAGGQIRQCTHEDNKTWQLYAKNKARGRGQMPMTINQANAAHVWRSPSMRHEVGGDE